MPKSIILTPSFCRKKLGCLYRLALQKWQLNNNNIIFTQYLYIILIWTFVINNQGDSEWKESLVYNGG